MVVIELIIQGTTIGVIQGDTRNLDNGSYRVIRDVTEGL